MKCLITCNKNSGKGKALKWIEIIKKRLMNKYKVIDIYYSRYKGDIKDYILVNGSNYDSLIVIGGDGTLNEAINGIMYLKIKPILGYIPSGTCNDFGKNYGLDNVFKCLDVIINNKIKAIDVFKINSDFFSYGMAVGNFSDVSYDISQSSKKSLGKLAYYFNVFKNIRIDKSFKCDLDFDNKIINRNCFCLIILKNKFLASFKMMFNNGCGKLIIINKSNRLINIIDMVMFFLSGGRYKHNIEYFDIDSIKINMDSAMNYNIDGERMPYIKKLDIKLVKSAIKMFVNK